MDNFETDAETQAANLGRVLYAVKQAGCPINQADMGKVSADCQNRLVGTWAWAVDDVIKGLEDKAKTGVSVAVQETG